LEKLIYLIILFNYFIEDESQAQAGKDANKQDKVKPAADKKVSNQNQVPLEPLPDTAGIVDHSKLKYLIDPYNESSIGCNQFFNKFKYKNQLQFSKLNLFLLN
jgi:hypothetical protein